MAHCTQAILWSWPHTAWRITSKVRREEQKMKEKPNLYRAACLQCVGSFQILLQGIARLLCGCVEREELEKVEGGGVGIRTEGKMSWRFTEAEFFVHFKKKKSFYCIPCFKRQRPESGVYTLDPSCTWAPINCPRNNIAPL